MANETLLQAVSDRLTAFQLALLTKQVPDADARASSVSEQFNAAISAWDSSELDANALPLLESLMSAVWDSLEFHNVREFRTSKGEVRQTCARCRYGVGHFSDGFSVANPDRYPHVFNKHLRHTKRHQVTTGKELIVVKRTTVGLPTAPSAKLSPAVAGLCSIAERRLAAKGDAAQTPEDRDFVTSALADISRDKDDAFQLNGQRIQLCGANVYILENAEAKAQGLNGGRVSSADRKYNAWQRENAQAEGTPETVDAWEYLLKTYPQHICERWKQYLLFLEDMGAKPQDRILTRWRDTGEFNKSNCFWATKKQWAAERAKTKSVHENENNLLPA